MTSLGHPDTYLFREPGQTLLSPTLIAEGLDISTGQLASALGVHRNLMRHHPENPTVQRRLGELAEVFGRLLELRTDPVTAAFHMKNTPIRILNHRTLFETVAKHDAAKAMRYLQSICGGQSG